MERKVVQTYIRKTQIQLISIQYVHIYQDVCDNWLNCEALKLKPTGSYILLTLMWRKLSNIKILSGPKKNRICYEQRPKSGQCCVFFFLVFSWYVLFTYVDLILLTYTLISQPECGICIVNSMTSHWPAPFAKFFLPYSKN